MSKLYIGIDIGKDGAIATIFPDGRIEVIHMPKIKTELDYHSIPGAINRPGYDSYVVYEKLGVIFGSSKQTAFSMGNQAGAIEMACVCQSIPYTKVRAVDWQKAMFQGVEEITKPSKTGKKPVRDTKAMALVAVKRIFPNLKLTFGERATVPHDGLIDAVLMAEWARRNNL
jgi:hypothetical protein